MSFYRRVRLPREALCALVLLLSTQALGQSDQTPPEYFDKSTEDSADRKLQERQAAREKAATQAALQNDALAKLESASKDNARLESENTSLRKEVEDLSQSLDELQHKEAAAAKVVSDQQPENKLAADAAIAAQEIVQAQAAIERINGEMFLPPLVESYDIKAGTVTVNPQLWKSYSMQDQLKIMRTWWGNYTLRDSGTAHSPIIVLDAATQVRLNIYDHDTDKTEQ